MERDRLPLTRRDLLELDRAMEERNVVIRLTALLCVPRPPHAATDRRPYDMYLRELSALCHRR